jgi:hypothetical protein
VNSQVFVPVLINMPVEPEPFKTFALLCAVTVTVADGVTVTAPVLMLAR